MQQNHSNIDWIRVADDPFTPDDHVLSVLQENYHHVAPIVDLWLSARTISKARRTLADQIQIPTEYYDSPFPQPTT